jgi:hypothetical protein
MPTDQDIWNQIATLTLAHETAAAGIVLPPLPDGNERFGPLKDILREFLASSPEVQERFSLQLENGQTFNDRDIAELLARDDSPLRNP